MWPLVLNTAAQGNSDRLYTRRLSWAIITSMNEAQQNWDLIWYKDVTSSLQWDLITADPIFPKTLTMNVSYLIHESEIWGAHCELKVWCIFCLSHCSAVCNTVLYSTLLQCPRYIVVIFLWITHKRHPIPRPHGRGLGCRLWVTGLTTVLPFIIVLLCALSCYIWSQYMESVWYKETLLFKTSHWVNVTSAFSLPWKLKKDPDVYN